MSIGSALVHKAITDVTRRKGRTLLVILGIMIGILGITAVNIANDVVGGAFIFSHDHTTVPDMIFTGPTFNTSTSEAVARVANVDKVQLRTEFLSRWYMSGGSGDVSLQINGYDNFSNVQLGTFQLTSGRLPGPGEIVLDSSDQVFGPVDIGSSITVQTPDGNKTLHVVGVARTAGAALARSPAQTTGYMRADALQQLAHLQGPNSLLVKISDTHQETKTLQAIETVLTNMQIKFNATAFDLSSGPLLVNGMITVNRLLALIALLLTSLLICNTINIVITEQVKIIGTMKAIGGTRRRIMGNYLISIAIYSVVGTLAGLVLGIIVGYQLAALFAQLVNIDLGPFQLSFWVVATSIAAGIIVPLIAALFPLWAGTRITVREAMATYGVSAGTGRSTNALGSRLTWVPQTVWLGTRGIFRRPMRVFLTVLALTIAAAVFMTVQTTANSIGYTLNQEVNSYTSDVSVQLGTLKEQPNIYQNLRSTVLGLPNVAYMEGRDTQSVLTDNGTMNLTGLEANSRFYQYHLVAGRWLKNAEMNSVVISDLAAQKLNLHVGDTLTLHENGLQASWKVVGIVHDLSADIGGNSVGNAFTTIQNMNLNFTHQPVDAMSIIMVRAQDQSQTAVDQLARRLDFTLHDMGVEQPTVLTRSQQIAVTQDATLIVSALFYTLAVIVALVGLLGLFNTLSTSVIERRLEIGILRSIGAVGRRVSVVFWIEGLALALMAWVIGTILGLPGAFGLVHLLSVMLIPFDFSFNPMLIVVSLLFVIAVTFVAVVGPALSASRVRIREILRYE